MTRTIPPDLTVQGLRFHYLVCQLRDRGWTQAKIAIAIGCHQTYVSDWQRMDLIERKRIGADVVEACMKAGLVHYDYFYADYAGLPDVVQTPEGPRKAWPGEADAQLFPVD